MPPKATKKTQVVVKNLKGNPVETQISMTVKSEPVESTNLIPITKPKPNYEPIAPVHFEELSNIWESDRRIPTRTSRIAWSLARNLNPINVNSWWYRRKIVAKKFKIKIPGGSYELDVGIPPLVIKLEELQELPTLIHAPESDGSDSAFPNSVSLDTLVDSSSSTCVDLVASRKNSPGYTDIPIKGAYIHDSKPSDDIIVASDCALNISAPTLRDSSPLPPSSPNVWSSSSLPPVSRITSPEIDPDRPDLPKEPTIHGSECILVLDHNFSTSNDEWKRIDLVTELDGPFEVLSESSQLLTPCRWSEAFLSFYTFPTWCFAGLRTAYDGSIVCDCLCSTRVESCSGETLLMDSEMDSSLHDS